MFLSEMVEGKRTLREVAAPVFEKTFDVIVCGLGTSGALAALFSAENGLSVLGIESFTCVGGTHTAGGVTGHYFGCPGGLYENIDQQVRAFAGRYTCTLADSRILVTEEALRAQGVESLYESCVCGVYLEGSTVVGVRVLHDGQMADFGAKIVMDCTAEACVAAIAGCQTEFGRYLDGQAQPYTIVSMLYDGQRYRFTNVDHGRVNQTDPADLSKAILFSRSHRTEAGKRELIAQMPLMGIREGRRILAEETVRLEDVFAGKQTDTPAFYSYSDLDKHGWDIAFDGEVLGDWAIGANLGAYNVTVAVPYQAILPLGFDGIVVPCRALGVDRDISSCVRMNLDMKKVAEVAAQWADLAIKQGKTLREVSYTQLRQRLTQSGCLQEQYNRGYRIDGKINWDGSPLVPEDVSWLEKPEDLIQGLETEKPGVAIWSAKQMGNRALPVLRALLASPEENLRKHAAFAVAMLGSHEADELLRDMVIQRDGLMLKDCRKHNNLRGCMAIYWLGRLGDREITEELISIICDPAEIQRAVYHQKGVQTTRYKVTEFEDVYFQFVSQTVMALCRIGDRHADLRSRIEKGFLDAFSTDAYYDRVTGRPKESSEGNMVLAAKNIAFSAVAKWKK